MQLDPETHFTSELGFTSVVEEGLGRGWGWHVPELCVPGTEFPHISVMLTLADIVTGILSGVHTAPRISLTADFRVRVFDPPPFGEYEMDGRLLRTGQTLSVGETAFGVDGRPEPFAMAVGTFVASPRPADIRPDGLPERPATRREPTLSVPFTERAGIDVLEPGVALAYLRADLANATASIQGGVLALLGEMAAHTLVSERAGRPFVVDDLDIRYLRAARVGPARSTARLVQLEADRATVAVELRDTGMDDRLVSHVTAQCRPADR